MRIKIQVDATRDPDERSVYKGVIFVVLEGQNMSASFDFQMETVEDGDGMNIIKIKQGKAPVFTPETLAGTHGILEKMCRQSVEQAIDLMEERKTNASTYAGNFSTYDVDAEEIKKFLRDISGDPVN